MAGIKISIHPLFFALGFFYAITGQILIFVICTATAIVHELGHSFTSANLGYRLNKITLMPFGAVVVGNIEGLKFSDQAKIALAGPIINIAVGLFFIAMWWIYPNCYAYTDVVVYSNLSMALVNLLPIYPLDGGRIIFCFLAERLQYDKAFTICKIIGGAFAFALLVLFALSWVNGTLNFSLLFFSLFVCFGTFNREKENKYVKIFSSIKSQNLKSGMPYIMHAVDKDITIKRLVAILDVRAVNQIIVYDGDKRLTSLSQEKIEEIIKNANIYSKLSEFL